MLLEGKVAELLTIRELVINIGANQQVREGMEFAVLPKSPIEITDPDSGESLGIIEREKVRVRATEVYDNFTICITCKFRDIPASGFDLSSIGPFSLGYSPAQRIYETLKKSDNAPSLPAITPEESFVQIGDRVRFVGDHAVPDDDQETAGDEDEPEEAEA